MANTGDRIKSARIAAGLTQSELAEKVGVQYSAIHKYENGLIVNLKRETIAKLAVALNVKPSYLLCLDDQTKPNLEPRAQLQMEIKKNPKMETKERLAFLFDTYQDHYLSAAKRAGIDPQIIHAWVNGKLPGNSVIDRVLGIFEVTPEMLLDQSDLSEYMTRSAGSHGYFRITEQEKKVVVAYRQQPELVQQTIDRILKIESVPTQTSKNA